MITAGIEPQPPRSCCEHHTDVTTEQSKRSVEYPNDTFLKIPDFLGDGYTIIIC